MKSLIYFENAIIIKGCIDDYKKLSHYHYRNSRLGPYKAIYSLCLFPESYKIPMREKVYDAEYVKTKAFAEEKEKEFRKSFDLEGAIRGKRYRLLGVIVYSMPPLNVELRNKATNGSFTGCGRKTAARLINKNIRTISRVIIDPRFRNLGFATRLVRQTMPMLNTPIIEAMAVMGHVHPFFEKAGMKPYTAPPTVNSMKLKQAFSIVGIEEDMFWDADDVHKRIEKLPAGAFLFLEKQILRFLQSYGRAKDRLFGLDRTRYVLSKLAVRPVYYIWFNQELSADSE